MAQQPAPGYAERSSGLRAKDRLSDGQMKLHQITAFRHALQRMATRIIRSCSMSIPFAESSEILVIRHIRLEATTGPIQGPVVYSTNPKSAYGEGRKFVVKGEDDRRIILAELVGHLLARKLGIIVPNFYVGQFEDNGSPVLASEMLVEDCARNVEPWFVKERLNKIKNVTDLIRIVLLDIWIANFDRNIGNLIGRTYKGTSEIDLVAIDFEKAATVREITPIVSVPMISLKKLWPAGLLGDFCKKTLRPDHQALLAIKNLTDGFLDQTLNSSIEAAGTGVETKDSILHILTQRRQKIGSIVQEVWPK